MNNMTNFTEWKAAVQAEADRLRAVQDYLNENGKERLNVMDRLRDLASFCGTAAELAEWIETKEDLDRQERNYLDSDHAQLPIVRLKEIAANEARKD